MKSLLMITSALGILLGVAPQTIDLDPAGWQSFVFASDNLSLSVKIPPSYKTFSKSLPAKEYNASSERSLLNALYDFGRSPTANLAEFTVDVVLVRLSKAVPTANVTALDDALESTFKRRLYPEDGNKPIMQSVRGRDWIYYNNSAYETYGATHETYGTLLDERTVLMVTGWYWKNIRKDSAWFESRRAILRAIRDRVNISPS